MLIAELQACGRSVDGRVQRVHLHAQAALPRSGDGRFDGPVRTAPKIAVQIIRLVHEGDCVRPAQKIPASGAARFRMGRGIDPSSFHNLIGQYW